MPRAAGRLFKARTALLLGFGVLLLLLVLSGLDAIHVLAEVRTSNEQIRREFLDRSRTLEQIRSQVYLSGTYIRDYLLEPDSARAEQHRVSLSDVHRRIESELRDYERFPQPDQAGSLRALRTEISAYWRTLEPVFSWNAEQRREQGYAFLRDKVFPRRASMLAIADQIAAVNERELTEGDRRLAEMFSRLRLRFAGALIVMVILGLTQAAATTVKILRLERRTEEHLAVANEARQELRSLSARLVAAQETERKAISRELHDAVGQSLSAALFDLQNVKAQLGSPNSPLAASIDGTRRLIESAVGMVRNMALLLRPSMLDDLGLAAALEWQAREVSRQTGISVTVSVDDLADELPDEHRTAVFRVVQEALHNVSRHAQAHAVNISVRHEPGMVTLSVHDDGHGFEPLRQKGLGLIGMHERAENLGGTVRVISGPGKGTLIETILPISAEASNAGR
jgi:signal transduction histidine kinase